MIEFNLKVCAQELVDVNTKLEKGTVQVTERLKLTLKGQQGDKKTRFTLLCDPELRKEYALKRVIRVRLDIPQTELDLEGASAGSGNAAAQESARPSASRGIARGRKGSKSEPAPATTSPVPF